MATSVLSKRDLQFLAASGGLVVTGKESIAELHEAVVNLVGKRSGGEFPS